MGEAARRYIAAFVSKSPAAVLLLFASRYLSHLIFARETDKRVLGPRGAARFDDMERALATSPRHSLSPRAET